MTKEYQQNMLKEGDWVHTEDGIGQVTLVFPVYYQYWEKASDDRYREETYGDNEKLADSLLGKRKNVGDWVKDIIYMKRLCDHDAVAKKRIMCFHTLAYANDGISKKEMAAVNKVLKDPKIAERFNKYSCKYRQPLRGWNVLIPVDKAVQVKQALDTLEHNRDKKLAMTMRDVELYFKETFGIDIFQVGQRGYPNAMLLTRMRPENDAGYYNENNEEIVCSIDIAKKYYDPSSLQALVEAQNLAPADYDVDNWIKCGWKESDL